MTMTAECYLDSLPRAESLSENAVNVCEPLDLPMTGTPISQG